MKADAFSRCHPVVNFVYFVFAIGFGVVIQHPVYLLAAVIGSSVYYLLLTGVKGIRMILAILPLCLLIAVVNPLFNTLGKTLLFSLFGRPYTLEALLYGAAVGGIFLVMMLWFGCYNVVLTSDKFTSLFGNLIPSLSLLLVMVLRMIPNLMRKAKQFLGARKSIGKGGSENAPRKDKVMDGMTIVSALTDWALEGSVVTGDAMRSRGYGSTKRSSFMVYRMTGMDVCLLVTQCLLILMVLASMITGGTVAEFTPDLFIAPIKGYHVPGFLAYWAYLLIPVILQIKETIQWHISRSRISAFPTPQPEGVNR